MTQPQTPAISHAERIRQLAVKRQRVLSGPTEHALDAILDHPQPAALVHSFPEADLHFLIHDIGLDDAVPLITLASNRQWEYLLDVSTWNRDRLDFRQATTWLGLLLRADPQRLVRWCFDEKLADLEFYLFRNIELRIRESDQPPSDLGEGFFTDDDTFYVRLVDYPAATPEEEIVKTRRNQVLGRLLRRLSDYDHPRFQGLLLEAANVIPGETEEELFRLRNVRLGEKGFLPFHEAVGVYQPLKPGDLPARGKKALHSSISTAASAAVPQFTTVFLDEDNLFVRALKGVGEAHVAQQLQVELASLCNQVISADRVVIRGRDQLRSIVSKVSGYLSIGLELTTDGAAGPAEPRASAQLKRHLLADIFRTGFAGALSLKWKAKRWYKQSWCQAQGMDLTFWDESWLGLIGGLLIQSPQFFDPANAGSNYRDFRSREEIDATDRNLDRVIELDRLLERMSLKQAPQVRDRLLTYKNLLLTLWAGAAMDSPPLAVSIADFKTFFASLWSGPQDRPIIGDGKRAEFLEWAARASDQRPADLSDRLGTVFEALFDQIESELASVKSGNIDPRHVHLFLLKP